MGGRMTVKPHLLLHYPEVIENHGPLRYHWCMRFEAKHREFKRYAKVNMNNQDLPMTLSKRIQECSIPFYMNLEKGRYFRS